jgi:hypothetical protein
MIIEGTTVSWLTLVGMAEGGVTALALFCSIMGDGAATASAVEIPEASGISAGAFRSDLPHARTSAATAATASKRRDE